jgi:hypothetical protein
MKTGAGAMHRLDCGSGQLPLSKRQPQLALRL